MKTIARSSPLSTLAGAACADPFPHRIARLRPLFRARDYRRSPLKD
ncbi:hypothetical protein [Ancylobacter sp.]